MKQIKSNYKFKFGTSGWRARMDNGEFCQDNVSRISHAIAQEIIDRINKQLLKPVNKKRGFGILVAFDARKNGVKYAKLISKILSCYGNKVFVSNCISTTPAVAGLTRESLGKDAFDLAVHVTASHNDARYNGIKILARGVVADDELTSSFAHRANYHKSYKNIKPEKMFKCKKIRSVDIKKLTFNRYKKSFSKFSKDLNSIFKRNSELSLFIDCMHGASGGFTKLFKNKTSNIKIVRTAPLSKNTFPQGKLFKEGTQAKPYRPEPKEVFLDKKSFANFKAQAAAGSMYIAIDGDGDRVACWVKQKNNIIELTPNHLGMLFGWYLHKSSKTKKADYVCKTLPTTLGMVAFAHWANKKLVVTPVGSKHFAPYLYDSSSRKALVATEESGHHGLTMADETWFDDAVCQAMLLIEIYARTGKSLIQNFSQVQSEIGFSSAYKRTNKDLKEGVKKRILDPLSKNPQKLVEKIVNAVGLRLDASFVTSKDSQIITLKQLEQILIKKRNLSLKDLIKLNEGINIRFKNSAWVQFRLSGTEPVARIYSEAPNEPLRKEIEEKTCRILGI